MPLFCAFTATSSALDIGDPAPPLRTTKWLTGGPVNIAKGRGTTLHVIEFCSRRCPQSLDRLWRLSRLQADFRDKNVLVVSIALEPPEVIEDYFGPRKLELASALACDYQGRTTSSYLEGVGAAGVPYTFVVDLEGRIAWHGFPGTGVGNVVQAVLSGEYDADVGREVRRQEDALNGALMVERWDTANSILQRIIELDPNPYQYQAIRFEVLALGKKDVVAAKACGRTLLEGTPHALDLDDFARHLLGGDFGKEYYDLAETFAEAAYKACDGQRKDIVHTYARTKYLNGDFAGAVELGKQAVELCGGQGDTFFKMALEKYQKAARQQH